MSLTIRKPWTSQPQGPISTPSIWTAGTSRAFSYGLGGVYASPASAVSVGLAPFAASKNFTVVLVWCAPLASQAATQLFRLGGASDGIRLDVATSGGGINPAIWTLNGVANGTSYIVGTSPFTTVPVVSVISVSTASFTVWTDNLGSASPTFSGPTGANYTQASAVIAPTDFNLQINGNNGSFGFYAVAALPFVVTDAQAKSYITNPWQLFAPLRRILAAPTIAVTIARPGSDITTTGWTGVPNNTNKYANIDEASADDSDYVQSPTVSGTVAPIIFGIVDQTGSPNTLPVGTWDVHVRATYIDGLTASQVRVTLLDSGGTSVGASSWQTVTASFATYTLSITTTGIAARIKVEVQ
jgi:hypothetical protein